jgi:hypothetical protein
MQDFDSLKNLWQQPAGSGQGKVIFPVTISNASASAKMKMQKQQLFGALVLVLTAVFIASLALWGNFNFIHWYTYGGMVLICVICIAQAILMYATYKKIKGIDDTVAPAAHLQQWEAYYNLRKKQNKWNMPLYYILLNTAMAIYLLEIFTGRPALTVSIFIAVYIGWMLFAYFYLGKKNIKKENNRLQTIIDELKAIEGQLNKED